MKYLKTITQWWQAPHLPPQNAYFTKDMREKGGLKLFNAYILKWIVHPIKRRFAKYYILALKKLTNIKVIAITGSAGKTSVKDMTESILKLEGKTVASHKNIDPVYNIPSTLLKCRPNTKYLILEMGVEYPGDMDFYLWLVKPDIVVINNIFPTHTQFFGDVNGVAREKKKIAKLLDKNGVVILNSKDEYSKDLKTKASKLYFGKSGKITYKNLEYTNDFKAKFQLSTGKDKRDVTLPALGEEYVQNSLAAAAITVSLGLELDQISKGLEKYTSDKHRMNVIKLVNGATVIDDSYNNNPEAAKAAVRTLCEISKGKKKNVVFGDMLELGSLEERYHKELGRYLAENKVDNLVGVGKASKDTVKEAKKGGLNNSYWVESQEKSDFLVKPLLERRTVTLIKGSRSIGLDLLVSRLSS